MIDWSVPEHAAILQAHLNLPRACALKWTRRVTNRKKRLDIVEELESLFWVVLGEVAVAFDPAMHSRGWDGFGPRAATYMWYAWRSWTVSNNLKKRDPDRVERLGHDWEELTDPGASPEDVAVRQERVVLVGKLLVGLSERERLVIERMLAGASQETIAVEIGRSRSLVQQLQTRAMCFMKQALAGRDL